MREDEEKIEEKEEQEKGSMQVERWGMRIEKEREIINLDKKGIGDGSSVQYTVS